MKRKDNPGVGKYKFGAGARKYKFGARTEKYKLRAGDGDWNREPMIRFGEREIQIAQQSQCILYFIFCFYKCQCSSGQAQRFCVFSVFNLKMVLFFFKPISIHFTLLKIATTRIIVTQMKISFNSLLKNTMYYENTWYTNWGNKILKKLI